MWTRGIIGLLAVCLAGLIASAQSSAPGAATASRPTDPTTVRIDRIEFRSVEFQDAIQFVRDVTREKITVEPDLCKRAAFRLDFYAKDVSLIQALGLMCRSVHRFSASYVEDGALVLGTSDLCNANVQTRSHPFPAWARTVDDADAFIPVLGTATLGIPALVHQWDIDLEHRCLRVRASPLVHFRMQQVYAAIAAPIKPENGRQLPGTAEERRLVRQLGARCGRQIEAQPFTDFLQAVAREAKINIWADRLWVSERALTKVDVATKDRTFREVVDDAMKAASPQWPFVAYPDRNVLIVTDRDEAKDWPVFRAYDVSALPAVAGNGTTGPASPEWYAAAERALEKAVGSDRNRREMARLSCAAGRLMVCGDWGVHEAVIAALPAMAPATASAPAK